jgi:hypothetical protein
MLRLLVVLVGCLSSWGVCCANEQALKAVLFDSAAQLVGSAVGIPTMLCASRGPNSRPRNDGKIGLAAPRRQVGPGQSHYRACI